VRLKCVGRVPGGGVGSPGASRLVNGHLQRPRPAIRVSSRVSWSSPVSATWALAFRARRNTCSEQKLAPSLLFGPPRRDRDRISSRRVTAPAPLGA
jgi:hypothetical protein